jgi:Bacteriophage N adsorption protein A C-term
MKAIVAVFILMLGLTVAPIVSARSHWMQFRADTYAAKGRWLLENHQWQAAAAAFAAAHDRSPDDKSYAKLKDLALALLKPVHRQAWTKPMRATPAPARKFVAATQQQPEYILMALIPSSGTENTLAQDQQGRYWGPIVRILPAQNHTEPAVVVASVAQTPATSHADNAYAALIDKDFSKARLYFAKAIANDARPQWIADNRPLTKWLSVQTGLTYRSGTPTLSATQTLLGKGGGWFDTAARLNGNPDKPLAVAAFLYSAQSLQNRSLAANSVQAGIGLRWRPMKNVTVEAARLIKVGAQSRNDWMLRAGAGTGLWRPADVSQTHWLHWQARADAALIGFGKADVFAQADGRIGLGIRLSDQLSLTPYLGSTATLQKDVATATLFEVSPGLWLHRAGNIPLDARIEYRRKIAGTAAASNGVAVTLAVGF